MRETCTDCPDLGSEYSANLIWYCKNDPRHACCNAMLRPGGKGCKCQLPRPEGRGLQLR